MNKAFTKENDGDDDDLPPEMAVPVGSKNYMTPGGWRRLSRELYDLVHKERPHMTNVVNWAASNGDRSENADYQYGKRRLREIDRRIRFLQKRLENAEVVDPETREATDQVFFSATVTYLREDGREETVSIVGIDETDLKRNYVSWTSPVARALLKAREGDVVPLRAPHGIEDLEIIAVCYLALQTEFPD
ncbi:transcription elongation factor GreB [Andreprevotia lacus DSM 23236]|jgi:transcription elongation factor GreB|uniref:Transcription elongation factor GreB n=1 Tax=Andreprevotia lacus DSM 23236 TaxID=1121001 RepID=A0A1W1XF87_9NEIS|nr:transcription elongation factor GreB [Andreprevotia lacus]SMC22258.1 transcription elongation factor GreB [Andreprevotia lacus DSM 23236]